MNSALSRCWHNSASDKGCELSCYENGINACMVTLLLIQISYGCFPYHVRFQTGCDCELKIRRWHLEDLSRHRCYVLEQHQEECSNLQKPTHKHHKNIHEYVATSQNRRSYMKLNISGYELSPSASNPRFQTNMDVLYNIGQRFSQLQDMP